MRTRTPQPTDRRTRLTFEDPPPSVDADAAADADDADDQLDGLGGTAASDDPGEGPSWEWNRGRVSPPREWGDCDDTIETHSQTEDPPFPQLTSPLSPTAAADSTRPAHASTSTRFFSKNSKRMFSKTRPKPNVSALQSILRQHLEDSR